jgi:hypothetical protein
VRNAHPASPSTLQPQIHCLQPPQVALIAADRPGHAAGGKSSPCLPPGPRPLAAHPDALDAKEAPKGLAESVAKPVSRGPSSTGRAWVADLMPVYDGICAQRPVGAQSGAGRLP